MTKEKENEIWIRKGESDIWLCISNQSARNSPKKRYFKKIFFLDSKKMAAQIADK
jgi:hypothetical protein